MEDLICPVCGEPNPPESETCSNCGSSLHAPIQPGDAPTRQNTSELEPILPDWLREAREKARDTDAREITQPLKKAGGPPGGSSDLLAGLNAQSNDNEDEAEVPDWLANITGAKSPKKPPETTGPRRVELNDFTAAGSGEEEPPAPRTSEASSDPLAWLSDLSEPGTQKPPEDDLQDWFKQTVAPTPPAEEPPAAASGNAGLMDWLDDLKSGSAAPAASELPESSLPAWLGGAEETPPAVPAETGGTPDWLKELQSKADVTGTGATPPVFSEGAPLSDWSTGAEAAPPAEEEKPEPAITPGDLPDWLNELRAASDLPDEPVEEPSAEVPSTPVEPGNFAWLREMQEAASAPEPEKPTPAFEDSSLPPLEGSADLDWLKDMQAESSGTPEQLPTPALSEEPDWFTQASTEAAPPETPQPASPLDVELPDWLRDATPESLAAPEESAELPDWMKTVPTEPAGTPAEAELPDWLSAPAVQAPVEGPAASEPPGPVRPGWLSGMPPVEQPPAEQPPFADEGELPLPALPGATLPSGGLDSLFTAMPDWLSEAAPGSSGEPAAAPTPVSAASSASPASPAESLTPANLPSWVQAMRPVEAVASGLQGGEDTLETQGPLAGLRGVLPALPYLGPANRPQAQSLKLNASNEQQNHGALLEQVLQSEIHPVPVAAAPRIYVQRGLHLVIGLLLFAALLGAVLMGTRILPLPVGWPAETVSAVQAVESIPAGAQVLVVFDYEPSLAGEMEAAAAPLLDHIIIRSHPILTLISTSPTGGALAERMFSGPLAELAYQDRVNLGYLPGGLGGVRSFVQNAAAAMPLAADSTPVTAGVRPYSEYAAILVITDSVEGGRTWIEQAGPPYYNGTAFVVVSSAQAGPMLQPYYHSRQINGLVSGLFDAAVLEQNNAGRPGLARAYWDAFNLGLILSVALITVGALWSLISALRERNSAEAG